MIKQFVNRERELEWMEEQHSEDSAFMIIYGRRRVGKTELIKEFVKEKGHVYYLATKKSERENIKDLQGQMAEYLDDEVFDDIEFDGWEPLFKEFLKRREEGVVIAVDEFPYLIELNDSVPSVFQKIWDENLKGNDVTLILCGSSIGMMETHVLGYKSPLYGRRTGQWKLKPFRFAELKEFFPDKDVEERLRFYSFLDGIPQYLDLMDADKNVDWNLKNKLMKKGAYLYEEAENLLVQEVRKLSNYFSILHAIAEGNTRYGEICNRAGLSKSLVSQYLKNLRDLHVVEKEFPVTQNKESRNALYKLTDNYYDFWFEFIYSHRSMLEEGKIKKVLKNEEKNIKRHTSFVFEQVCREYLQGDWDKVGRWWRKGEEIDVAGLRGDDEIIFGECKWSKNKVGVGVFYDLKEKAGKVRGGGKDRNERFILF
ncbi:MAG: ATP-binding protein, partial [Thermoplasmatota archaeon]